MGLDRVDSTRVDDARRICDFVVSHVHRGRYVPPEALWPESLAYLAELAATLSMAGSLLGEPHYVRVATTMFDHLLSADRRVDGLWPIGYWCEFPVYHGLPLDWREQDARPEARTTALVLYSLGVHHLASREERFVGPAREAMARMFRTWDFERQKESLLHLSAEAAALAALGWEHALPEFADEKRPLIEWAHKTFAKKAPGDFPFFTMFRSMLLLAATGTRHLDTAIRPAIDALLAEPSWRFSRNPQDFHHQHELNQHVDVRANGAMAITMRLFDLAAGGAVYTDTPLYRYLSEWMDRMRTPEGSAYGCLDIPTGRRYCLGSPPQYMQLWWMLGGFYL